MVPALQLPKLVQTTVVRVSAGIENDPVDPHAVHELCDHVTVTFTAQLSVLSII
jgi:hypothetical protein